MNLIETMRAEMSELPELTPRAAAIVAAKMWVRDGQDPALKDIYEAGGLARYKIGQTA